MPSIVVEEPQSSSLSIPRTALPSLDLTHLRHNMGAGYSPTSPSFDAQDRLHVYYSPNSDAEDESFSAGSTWSNLGGPDSHIATSSGNVEL